MHDLECTLLPDLSLHDDEKEFEWLPGWRKPPGHGRKGRHTIQLKDYAIVSFAGGGKPLSFIGLKIFLLQVNRHGLG